MLETHPICLCPDRNGATRCRQQRKFQLYRDEVAGMYQVRNNRRLARHLVAYICARPAIIVDPCDAAAFIGVHSDHTRLWVVTEAAVKCADRTPS